MKIYLVRHGETEANKEGRYQGWTETDLTTSGYREAELTGRYLSSLGIDALYCSDLIRAKETARIIGEKCNVEPIVDPLLRELHFGHWEGLNYWEIKEEWAWEMDQWFSDPFSVSPPGGENLNEACRRMQSFAKDLEELESPPSQVVVVSHGGSIRAWLAHLMNEHSDGFWDLKLGNTSISLVEKEQKGDFRLVYRNFMEHLETEPET